jgi:FAD synthetase
MDMRLPEQGGVRVIAFGAFDPLNEGQIDFLRQAKALGDHLLVVVAHEEAIWANKGRDQKHTEEERIAAVKALGIADDVMLGRKNADRYHLLREVDFDVVALGYNQKPTNDEVQDALHSMGKWQIKIVRLKPYKPDEYPSE